jgi:hypothetical protein
VAFAPGNFNPEAAGGTVYADVELRLHHGGMQTWDAAAPAQFGERHGASDFGKCCEGGPALGERDGDGCQRRRGPMFDGQRQVIAIALGLDSLRRGGFEPYYPQWNGASAAAAGSRSSCRFFRPIASSGSRRKWRCGRDLNP